MCVQMCFLRKKSFTLVTFVSNILMYTFDMDFQTLLPIKVFVTLITIVEDFVMSTSDMLVQIFLPDKAPVALITIVPSNFLMHSFDMYLQI